MAQQPFDQPQWNDNGDGTVSENVNFTGANGILPMDLQSHLTSTIQTQNAVSVAASGSTYSSYYSCDGFKDIAFNVKNDANTSIGIEIRWSNDGSTDCGYESIYSGTLAYNMISKILDVKGAYFRFTIWNNDTVAHTLSAWAYLKA